MVECWTVVFLEALVLCCCFYERRKICSNLEFIIKQLEFQTTRHHGPLSLWLRDKSCCTRAVNTFIACIKNSMLTWLVEMVGGKPLDAMSASHFISCTFWTSPYKELLVTSPWQPSLVLRSGLIVPSLVPPPRDLSLCMPVRIRVTDYMPNYSPVHYCVQRDQINVWW